MRSSIGGWLAKRPRKRDWLCLMPWASKACGSSPDCRPPRRARALIIGRLSWRSCAEPASARNSRWRENQATIIEARMPSRIWDTSEAMKKPGPTPRSVRKIALSTT